MSDVISSDDITEMPEMPDPSSIPASGVDTSTAFSGEAAPIKKDPEDMVAKRGEGKLPVQESETSMVADNVSLTPDEPIPQTPPPGE